MDASTSLRRIEPVGVDLDPPELPKLAEALGGAGGRAEASKGALQRPGPTVVEIPG